MKLDVARGRSRAHVGPRVCYSNVAAGQRNLYPSVHVVRGDIPVGAPGYELSLYVRDRDVTAHPGHGKRSHAVSVQIAAPCVDFNFAVDIGYLNVPGTSA